MPRNWAIKVDWESLDAGSDEERAGFAALGVKAYGLWLTGGHDRLLQSLRDKPFLSSYHFAEWLAWNWWRLRWEPRKLAPEWELAHRMSSIGAGYIWPDIDFSSDGHFVTLSSRATPERAKTPFRYLNDSVSVVSVSEFEAEIDDFIEQVIQRLHDRGVLNSNLETLWNAVSEERKNPTLTRHRKLEALLGEDPDDLREESIARLIEDSKQLGVAAMEEIAANRSGKQQLPSPAELIKIGRNFGFDSRAVDCVTAKKPFFAHVTRSGPAWHLGVNAARALRVQEGLGSSSISDKTLTDMCGTHVDSLTGHAELPELKMSFTFKDGPLSHLVLRSKWHKGRRFELARLLGDRLCSDINEPVRPATRSDTYRQKVQRAFAAELLCPFSEVQNQLEGDYSMEKQQDVAESFGVSELVVRTLLANNGLIDPGDFEWESASQRGI